MNQIVLSPMQHGLRSNEQTQQSLAIQARCLPGERVDVVLIATQAQGMQQDVSQYGSREKVRRYTPFTGAQTTCAGLSSTCCRLKSV